MEAQRYGEWAVFAYSSWLHTRAALLAEIYCESHRWEPWAVHGDAQRYGGYRFPNVLYVPQAERETLLADIPRQLHHSRGYAQACARRFRLAARRLLGGARAVGARDRRPATVAGLIRDAGQVLSVGVFKEALEPPALIEILERFFPVDGLEAEIFALYQPLCLPHYQKVEAKLLFAAACHGSAEGRARHRWLTWAVNQAAHHSQFLLEPTALAEPAAMRTQLGQLWETHRRSPARLAAARRLLLRQNRTARARSLLARQRLLGRMARAGSYTLHSKRLVIGMLEMVQWLATWEELKHILVMQAARQLRLVINELGLAYEKADSTRLLGALTASAPRSTRPARGRPRRSGRR